MRVVNNDLGCGLFMLLWLLSGSLYAGDATQKSTLSIPEDFNVTYVDGLKNKANFFSPGGAELTLSKGEHRVVMIYDQFFERGDDTDRIKSAAFMLSFVIEQEGSYELQFAPPKSSDAAKEFAKNPQVEIVMPKLKSALPVQITYNIDPEMYLASYAKAAVLPVLVNETAVPVSAPVPKTSATQTPEVRLSFSEHTAQKESARIDPNVLQQLKYWWQQADKNQRDEFLESIKNP